MGCQVKTKLKIMGGHNNGVVGIIRDIEAQSGKRMRTITLETEEKEIKTTDNNIFIIGKDKPVIEIPTTNLGGNNET